MCSCLSSHQCVKRIALSLSLFFCVCVSRSETKPDLTFVEKWQSSRGNRGMKGGREEEKTVRGSSSPQKTRGSTSVCLPLLGEEEEEDFWGITWRIKWISWQTESECFTLEFAETKLVFTPLDYQSWRRILGTEEIRKLFSFWSAKDVKTQRARNRKFIESIKFEQRTSHISSGSWCSSTSRKHNTKFSRPQIIIFVSLLANRIFLDRRRNFLCAYKSNRAEFSILVVKWAKCDQSGWRQVFHLTDFLIKRTNKLESLRDFKKVPHWQPFISTLFNLPVSLHLIHPSSLFSLHASFTFFPLALSDRNPKEDSMCIKQVLMTDNSCREAEVDSHKTR